MRKLIYLIPAVLLCFSTTASAQLFLAATDMSNGFAFGSNNTFQLAGTLGQTLIGEAQNANTWTGGGFWFAARYNQSVITNTEEEASDLPTEFQLDQNYPNPFNPTTQIRFGLPEPSVIRLSIYNLLGQEVHVLVNGEKPAGWHTVTWNGRDQSGSPAASGIYLYHLHTPDYVNTRKMMLIK